MRIRLDRSCHIHYHGRVILKVRIRILENSMYLEVVLKSQRFKQELQFILNQPSSFILQNNFLSGIQFLDLSMLKWYGAHISTLFLSRLYYRVTVASLHFKIHSCTTTIHGNHRDLDFGDVGEYFFGTNIEQRMRKIV
jgi:hypothetical protein